MDVASVRLRVGGGEGERREGLSWRRQDQGQAAKRGRVVGKGGCGAGRQGWEREPGRPGAPEREASYQTLSRRSNYCQLGTPRLCRLS